MSFTFTPAVRRNTHLLLALAGASGSGKTFSALELATGLAGATGKVAVIDTEAGRSLHYADRFRFDHCELTPPFTPQRYREAIEAAESAGYAVIVTPPMVTCRWVRSDTYSVCGVIENGPITVGVSPG